ncbi:unnamed protein product [Blepharisma stoltei]|uniref:Uncharacterized protein n=1 Tax=Blepharisma stoltei TaxID=1481888 RepID=A0AAU9JVN8_9CILI|nr:unnamed protein product [Blepharisma stoltei]
MGLCVSKKPPNLKSYKSEQVISVDSLKIKKLKRKLLKRKAEKAPQLELGKNLLYLRRQRSTSRTEETSYEVQTKGFTEENSPATKIDST